MSKRAKKTVPLTMWHGPKYFDAKFTNLERGALRKKLMEICGYADSRSYSAFDYEIERPAQDQLFAVASHFGLTWDDSEFHDWVLIHIAKSVGLDYKNFAQNVPKLPIDSFVALAIQEFPEFTRPQNKVQTAIQLRQLRILWSDWCDQECLRTGCTQKSHWLCRDRYVAPNKEAILLQIANANEQRKARRKIIKAVSSKPAKRAIQLPRPMKRELRLAYSRD